MGESFTIALPLVYQIHRVNPEARGGEATTGHCKPPKATQIELRRELIGAAGWIMSPSPRFWCRNGAEMVQFLANGPDWSPSRTFGPVDPGENFTISLPFLPLLPTSGFEDGGQGHGTDVAGPETRAATPLATQPRRAREGRRGSSRHGTAKRDVKERSRRATQPERARAKARWKQPRPPTIGSFAHVDF